MFLNMVKMFIVCNLVCCEISTEYNYVKLEVWKIV